MTVVVKENYPVSRLPKELQETLEGVDTVRLTIEAEAPGGIARPDLWAKIQALRSHPDFKPRSNEEIDAELRALRDEWD